jgi:Ran GTPase-activating protein (RanGAP) involved in mRNA processing and transport
MNNLKKLGVGEEHLTTIKENYSKKNEKFKIYLLNIIKSLVKKCTDTIRNSTIEMNNKILYDFRNYSGDDFVFAKNNLQIFCDKINNSKIEALINMLKYAPEKIIRIHFNNSFNKDLSEYSIQKILLNLMTYNLDLLSLSFNNCENINNNIISYVIFAVQNLKKIRILGFESCKLNDSQIKIITEGIKENKSIIALMLRKNNISSQGAFFISEYLNNNTNVRQLFLGDNNIKDKGLKSLLSIMSTNNKNITNLDLSNNKFKLGDFNTLIEYLKTDPILNSLDISGNKLDLKSSINLGATLCNMKNIKSLNMSNMGIISEFIPNLFRSFSLDDIILDDNNLEEVGLIMLIKGLEGNKNLKKISLRNTQLSFIGLTSLLKMLDKAKDFKELHIENNIIDDSCVNIMVTTLKTKQFKIFVTKSMINQELFKENALGQQSNIIMV